MTPSAPSEWPASRIRILPLAARIFATTLEVFRLAGAEGVPPAVAADRLAERRMADVSRLRGFLLPRH